MRFRVAVTRKDGLRDPEGVATLRAVRDLGFGSVAEVHFGKVITIDLDEEDEASGLAQVTDMCDRLLANPA